jgi:predicted DCC family thiol-disulfide oxidoreductase YuxK
MSEGSLEPDGLMLFDGLCNFCSASVNLALALDRRGALRFCPIQSPYGQALARKHGLDPADPTTFVFFQRGEPLTRSAGVLALAGYLQAPWRWASALRLIPPGWRDGAYDWIAANRYRLFGRRQVCRLPSAQERSRFITEPPVR